MPTSPLSCVVLHVHDYMYMYTLSVIGSVSIVLIIVMSLVLTLTNSGLIIEGCTPSLVIVNGVQLSSSNENEYGCVLP